MPQEAKAISKKAPAMPSNPIPLIMQNREKMASLPPDIQIKLSEALFRTYLLPKLRQQNPNISLDDVEQVKQKFVGTLTGVQTPSLEIGKVDNKPSLGGRALGAMVGGGAGVAGSLARAGELIPGMKGGPLAQPLRNLESRAFEDAKTIGGEGAANVGAGVGHLLPAMIASGKAGGLVPSVEKSAPLAIRTAAKAGKGIVEGAAFGTFKEGAGKDIEENMLWGGLLESAFPILGHFLGKGRKSKLPTSGASPESVVPSTTVSPTPSPTSGQAVPSNLSDLKDIVAQEKFGKPFGNLTASEKATLPAEMKSRLASMKQTESAAKRAAAQARKVLKEQEQAAKVNKPVVAKAKPNVKVSKPSTVVTRLEEKIAKSVETPKENY
jgi:hypothetical protein